MKIDKIQIQNFKSILDSGEVSLDKNITTFIGKNEQGKTNYLKALESFNKDIYYKDDDLCHHLDKTIEDTDIPIVTIWFKLDKNDKINLGDIKEELAQIERLKVTKYYDGRYYFEIDEPQIATTVLDHINNAEENVLDIKSQLIVLSQTVSPNIGLLHRIDCQTHIDSILSCLNADGGFGHLPGQPSNISFTYYAIGVLKELNVLDKLDKEKIIAFSLSTQHQNGGFGHLLGGQPQIQFTHDAIAVLKELDALNRIDYQNVVNFILSCQNA
ncbi:MAG: AAA family ATPase, partial [Methanosarcinales archaeon]|nr:AAA family ATPase [Methanosarcinales archaeon]